MALATLAGLPAVRVGTAAALPTPAAPASCLCERLGAVAAKAGATSPVASEPPGDAEAGLACHLAATALPSANAYDWFHRARAEQHVGKDADATTSYERSVMSPRPPVLEPQAATEAYFQLGKLWRDQHDLGKASRFYTASIRLSPSSAGAYIMSGVTLRELGRDPLAG